MGFSSLRRSPNPELGDAKPSPDSCLTSPHLRQGYGGQAGMSAEVRSPHALYILTRPGVGGVSSGWSDGERGGNQAVQVVTWGDDNTVRQKAS